VACDPRPPRLGLRWAGCYRGLFDLRVFARPVARVVFLESRAALLALPYPPFVRVKPADEIPGTLAATAD
jgi:hypothetical protein